MSNKRNTHTRTWGMQKSWTIQWLHWLGMGANPISLAVRGGLHTSNYKIRNIRSMDEYAPFMQNMLWKRRWSKMLLTVGVLCGLWWRNIEGIYPWPAKPWIIIDSAAMSDRNCANRQTPAEHTIKLTSHRPPISFPALAIDPAFHSSC